MSTLIVKNLDAPTGESIVAPDLQLPSGSVVQIKNVKVTSFSSINCANVWATLTTLTITPQNANSSFYVTGHAMIGNATSGGLEMGMRIKRVVNGVTTIPCVANSSGSTLAATLGHQIPSGSTDPYATWTPSWSIYDEPSTTDDVTYHLEYYGSENQTAYYNRMATSSDAAYNVHGTTTITVMEIAG